MIHAITNNEGMVTAQRDRCLGCQKKVRLAEGFVVEVKSIEENELKGYLHPVCRAAWEKENPGFVYGPLTPPFLRLKFIPETWSSEGYVEKCCTACVYKVRITSTEISDELYARQMLDHKMFEHEAEQHSG